MRFAPISMVAIPVSAWLAIVAMALNAKIGMNALNKSYATKGDK